MTTLLQTVARQAGDSHQQHQLAASQPGQNWPGFFMRGSTRGPTSKSRRLRRFSDTSGPHPDDDNATMGIRVLERNFYTMGDFGGYLAGLTMIALIVIVILWVAYALISFSVRNAPLAHTGSPTSVMPAVSLPRRIIGG